MKMATLNVISEVCDLEKLSVRDLKAYLRDRGEKVSGNRPELIKRAKGAFKLGARILTEIHLENKNNTDQRELEKFTTPLSEKLPKPWEINNWDADVDRIPFLRSRDLYNYLVLNRNRTFDSNSTNAKRLLKAKVFYQDKHVHNVMYSDITTDCSHCYVRCNVIPSMPTASVSQKPDYNTWVCLAKMSGNVHSAGCTCSAGEGESCNHIAALLYAIVDISGKRKDGLHAPTSSKCLWNQPRKRKLSPRKSQHLVFKKHKFSSSTSDEETSNIKLCTNTSCASADESRLVNIIPLDANSLREKLKLTAPHAAFLLTDSKFKVISSDHIDVNNLHNINFMYHDRVNLKNAKIVDHFKIYFCELKCSESESKLIEEKTRRQSLSQCWLNYRNGRITSSNFGRICKLKDNTPVDNVLKSILNYTDSFTSKSTEWGKSHESAARRVYHKNMQKEHNNIKTEKCGLIIDPNLPHLGCSPDGLVNCSHCAINKGVLEIKCPYSWRLQTPIEASKDKAFFCELSENGPKLKRSHQYYFQVQGQMAISNRKWCDFFVWTLKGFSVERIDFDPIFWSSMLVKINDFYISAVIPELWSERVKRGLPLFN